MNTSLLQLTPNDAYAFRRVLSKMDVPDDLVLSPLASLLLKLLDPQNKPAGWQTLQDIATQNHEIMQQIMYIDPKSSPPKIETKDNDKLYVPPLPVNAQLSDALIADASKVGHFHRDCAEWLKQKSPMTPRIFLESAPLWAVGLAIARRCVLRLSFDDYSSYSLFSMGCPNDLLSQKYRIEGNH